MLQRKKIPRDCGAFTLIEVALAAAVLLFAIVSAFQLVVAGSAMLDLSRKQTIAAQIIHAEIDDAHNTTWSTVSGWVGSSTVSMNSQELMTLKNVASGFNITRVVAYVTVTVGGVTTTRTDMVQITFTVTWTARTWAGGGSGKTYTRQGTTYVGKNGLSSSFQRS